MPYEITTVNLGIVADAGAFIAAGGTQGKRIALPNSRFRLSNPTLEPPRDNEGKEIRRTMQASDMKVEIEEVLREKKKTIEGYKRFTGRSEEQLKKDFLRNFWLTAPQARDYGLIDNIVAKKR